MAKPKPYDNDGTPASGPYAPKPIAVDGVDTSDKPQIAALAAVATPDATDEATAITLANALKVRINQVIAALKA